MGYLDVHTENVAAAGRRTAATSDRWQTLERNIKTALDGARSSVLDVRVAGAVENFGEQWNPVAARLVDDVTALGNNTTTAANHVHNADADANTHLIRQGEATEQHGSALRRPITA